MTSSPGEVTKLLLDLKQGDRMAEGRLIPVVYDQLRRIAAAHLRREARNHSLQPTALVNEAYLELVKAGGKIDWQSRSHFFAVSSNLMRRVLVDRARANLAAKRGGGANIQLFDEKLFASPVRPAEFLALDDALTTLEQFDKRQAQIVEMHIFGGMTEAEIAGVLGISERTVKRDWRASKAWLYAELKGSAPASGSL